MRKTGRRSSTELFVDRGGDRLRARLHGYSCSLRLGDVGDRWKKCMVDPDLGRRRHLLTALAALGLAGAPTPQLLGIAAAQELLAPTPACDDGDDPTPE